MSVRITAAFRAGGQDWARVRYPDGMLQDEPLSVQPPERLAAYRNTPAAVRDGAVGAVGDALAGIVDDWQAEWRQKAHAWIGDLNKLGLRWTAVAGAAQKAGRDALVTRARENRASVKMVRDWAYTVIDTYLGGVDQIDRDDQARREGSAAATSIRDRFMRFAGFGGSADVGSLGAFPLALAIKAGSTVTVATLAAWVANQWAEVRKADQALLARGAEMMRSADPSEREAGKAVIDGTKAAGEIGPGSKPSTGGKWLKRGLFAGVLGLGVWQRDRIAKLLGLA